MAKPANDSTPLVARVFAQLADGQFHSGEDLAHALRVTRSAVWKAAGALRELGVSMEAVRNKGYRLENTGEPLDAKRIRMQLPEIIRAALRSIEVQWSIDSTNSALVARPNPPLGYSEALLAEFQTAGRGRRGRQWLAPPGGAICLSLSWTFPQMPRDAGSLGLAMGVCVLRALQGHGITNAQLKWPNDLLVDDRKLGGILTELRAESEGPACAVVGIGLNVSLGGELLANIAKLGLPAIDLATASGRATISRNSLVAGLIEHCVLGLRQFEREGLKPFLEAWRDADALRGRQIDVRGGDDSAIGIARGVDINGALLVETPQGLRKFLSGDVSVRPVS